MIMTTDELRLVKVAYVRQKQLTSCVGSLSLWQAYFILLAAWRDIFGKAPFGLPDSWLLANAGIGCVYPEDIKSLRIYLNVVDHSENCAACTVLGCTGEGKKFLIEFHDLLVTAIEAFGLTSDAIRQFSEGERKNK